jgi:NodT family efflux transporter outer membrane factor (OMF) lipoprotein
MKRVGSQSAVLAALTLALAGCGSLVPPSGSPQGSLRDTFRPEPVTAEVPLSNAAEASEWDAFFVDPGLRRVVALALAGNRSLRASMAAVDRARAQYGISEAARWPELAGTATVTRQRNAGGAAGANAGGGAGGTTGGTASTSYSVSLGVAAWEIDLFGRLASLEGAALSRFLAQQQTQQSARLSVVAQVAEAWLTLSADVQRVRLADELRASQQRSLNLIERQYQLGAASGLQLARAQTAFEAARAEAARSAAAANQARLALELLAGQPLPDSLLPTAQVTQATALPDLPAGLPAAVLLQRPDLLAAEQALEAAAFDVGAARAARFPRLTLTANAGTRSPELGDLLRSGSSFWNFIPGLELPLLDAGARRAQVDVSEATRREAMANYEAALQSAFREVADALAVRDSLAERLAAQAAQVDAARRTLDLAEQSYRLGASSQLELLDAQREFAGARQGLVSLRQIEQSNRVVLLRTLGGRWSSAVPPAPLGPRR